MQDPSVSNPSAPADATLPVAARAVLIGLLTLGMCLLARAVSGGQPLSLLLWPALGVAFAFGWRWGRVWTLPAAFGALAYGLIAFDSVSPALAVAIGTGVAAIASIEVLRRFNAWNPAEYRLQPVLRFLAVALAVAAPTFAVILGLGGGFHHLAPGEQGLDVLLGAWLAAALLRQWRCRLRRMLSPFIGHPARRAPTVRAQRNRAEGWGCNCSPNP
jgi:hypothetical protein